MTNPGEDTAAEIELRGATKVYSTDRGPLTALSNIDLRVQKHEFLAVVGSSGCGKTTLLNLIAGLEKPTSGTVHVGGKPVAGPGPDRVMVFQEHNLFPWLTVAQNVAYGLAHSCSKKEARERAMELLKIVELERFAHAGIHELSGGMKQRAALARALAPDPSIILFDEPFASLDALTRECLYAKLQEILSLRRNTAVFVTHNTREAACLAERVLVLAPTPGRVISVLPIDLPHPRDFYDPQVSSAAGLILHELRRGQQAEAA